MTNMLKIMEDRLYQNMVTQRDLLQGIFGNGLDN